MDSNNNNNLGLF